MKSFQRKKMTYLPNKILILMIVIGFLLFFFGHYGFFIFYLGFSILILWLNRKQQRLSLNKDKNSGLIISPITGVISDIREHHGVKILHIKKSFFEEWGLYMPQCGKIEKSISTKMKKYFFTNSIDDYLEVTRENISITNRLGDFDLCIIPRKLSTFSFWLEGGDYAFTGARIGIFKGAGDVLLFLPNDYSIVIEKGLMVNSGKTVLAANTMVKI